MSAALRMPGKSYHGPFSALTEEERKVRDALQRDVAELAGGIGERNLGCYEAYMQAADWIETRLSAAGLEPERQEFRVAGQPCFNLDAEIRGAERPEEIVVVGAHYDSVPGSPGANDNGTGVAAMLALAEAFAGRRLDRTLRLAAFANEEPPYFQTADMGSAVYADRCRERKEKIVAMLSLETIGCYHEAKGSQEYPFPFSLFYPSTGDFLAFVANLSSRPLLRRVVGAFRDTVAFPSEGGAFPEFIPGIAWSDQWAFWRAGYPAVMVTDTAPFRYDAYHTPYDTPDRIQYDRLARVALGLKGVVEALVSG